MGKKIWFTAFGAPGTGKTTLLNKIVAAFPEYTYVGNYAILTENTLLNHYLNKLFIDEDFSYFFKFQMEVLPQRFRDSYYCAHNSFVDKPIYDTYAYAKTLRKLKWIEDHEYQTFYSNFVLLDKLIPKPNAIIYLKCTSVYLILSRFAQRGRSIEKKYTLEYIEALLETFDEVACEMKIGHSMLEFDIEQIEGNDLYESVIEQLNLQ